MRDFSRLAKFLSSNDFQALRSKANKMSDREYILAARAIWDATITSADVPIPEHAVWPTETIQVDASWDDNKYIVTFSRGNLLLRDNLIDKVVPLPFDTENDAPFMINRGEPGDVDEYFLVTGITYDDEVFILAME